MTPIKNNVIIRPFLPESRGDEGYTTPGGIFIPEQVEEHRADKNPVPRAIVVSIGSGVEEVVVGDEVMYNKFAAKHLGEGYDLFTINVNEILGIVQTSGI